MYLLVDDRPEVTTAYTASFRSEGIASLGYQPGPYSNREELLIAFDRWLLERTGPL